VQAVYLTNPYKIHIADLALPVRRPGEALIRVKATGVCGSDITAYRGVNPTVIYPVVVGHETAGEIVEADPDTPDLKPGDRVVVEPYVSCGNCYPCSLGRTNTCERLQTRGVHIDGTMAEQISHPARLLHKIPEGISWTEAALSEPLTIALHAVHRAEVKAGEHVVITGAGPIGLLAAQVIRTLGAEPILIDPLAERLAVAREMGIRYAISPAEGVERVREITKDRLAEALIEASGAEAAIVHAADYVAYAGRISLVGWPKGAVLLGTATFIRKELDIRGSRNSAREFPEAIRLIACHQVQLTPFVSRVVRLAEIPAAMVDQVEHPEQFIKIVAVS
jgi:2-desacetyl-2-hydroxyethyl bacteriochlorophyllide A dehydrogenase